MQDKDWDATPNADPESRREEINSAYAKITNEERQANQAKTLREHNMKLLGWPPPPNRG
ncbi:hypothetical protein IHQ71_30525 (plasmid) [Rhizobium sp. TH2]|uniref:hypothetical protein n=1 Tax=Rhizobium sp. TH2 TaxID=2775403 RepID=UPI002156FFC3|nr:hypothetical protein [Rhizobium sp. TH2]UVC12352.1 hypothetical protein IHQ71_30525 [Rhizobium sp. TH2]